MSATTSLPSVSAVLLFAPVDRTFAQELEKQLRLLPAFEIWHEEKLLPGVNRKEEISIRVCAADMVIALVSPDLLASDDLVAAMQALEERRSSGQVRIVPILLRTCGWEYSVFSGMQPLPRNGKPVARWSSRDEAWIGILRALETLTAAVRDGRATNGVGGASADPDDPSLNAGRTDHAQLVRDPGSTARVALPLPSLELQLYDALILLLPGQMEEVLFRARIPTHAISSSSVPMATRASELMTLVKQQRAGGLDRLADVVQAIAPGLLGSVVAQGTVGAESSRPLAHRHSPEPEDPAPTDKPRAASDAVSVIVLTALRLECLAVLTHLTDLREEVLESGTVVEVGTLRMKGGPVRVGVVEAGAGNIPVAATAQEVFSHFKPAAVLFVGVAGGIKDVRVGDVVAATRVYGFESGKAADDFLSRPDVAMSSNRLIQRARAEARKERWRERLEPVSGSPVAHQVYIGPIAAGSQVIASTRSPLYQFLVQHYSDALAVEMEGRGFLEAAWRNQIDALVVRGISDLIDKKSESDATGSQPLAARNAAAFAFEVIANLTLK